jgi:hypothetical protein
VVAVLSRASKFTAALFAVFAAGAGVAQAAEAPEWVLIALGVVAGCGAVAALCLVLLEPAAQRAENDAQRALDQSENHARSALKQAEHNAQLERERAAQRLEQEQERAAVRLQQEQEQAAQRLREERESPERLGRALELLGDVDKRQGAIYLLEHIARDAPAVHHGPVVEVLVSYIRRHSPSRPPGAAVEAGAVTSGKQRPPADVQAALTVLGRRDPAHDDARVQLRLSDVDLRGASLRGGHFEGIRLRRALLEGARLEGADLRSAELAEADLRRADFAPDQELGLLGADLSCADLKGADLKGADLKGAKLDGAKLDGAVFDERTRWPEGFVPPRAGSPPG